MNNQIVPKKRIISLKLAKKLLFVILFVLIFDFYLFPAPVMASEPMINSEYTVDGPEINETADMTTAIIKNNLPDNLDLQTSWSTYRTITAYTSESSQCDASPCITANGFNVCKHGEEDTIAANFLKYGTKVRIPELFGNKIFIVRDRMNSRYPDRVDIWMLDKDIAKKFGKKIAKIEILE